MKKTLALTALLILITGISYAKDCQVKKKAGDYAVEASIVDPRVGANDIAIQVKDRSGNYVTDAAVNIKYSMPEGVDLPPMHFTTDAQPKGNQYTAKMKIPMPGTWTTVVSMTRAGKTSSIEFPVEVHKN